MPEPDPCPQSEISVLGPWEDATHLLTVWAKPANASTTTTKASVTRAASGLFIYCGRKGDIFLMYLMHASAPLINSTVLPWLYDKSERSLVMRRWYAVLPNWRFFFLLDKTKKRWGKQTESWKHENERLTVREMRVARKKFLSKYSILE